MRIIFAWWGTWWHIYPSIAIANRLSNTDEVLFIVSNSGLDKKILSKATFNVKQIYSWKLRRYFDIHNFIDPIFILFWIIQSFFIIIKFKPDIIFCKWWYVCIPVAIAWWIYKKLKIKSTFKIILHESDMIMWLSNRIIFKFADKVIWGIKDNMNPVREVWKVKNENSKKWKGDLPVLLVMWWSQWAQQLNDLIIKIFPKIKDKYFVIHLTWKWKQTEIKHENYLQFEYLDEDYFETLSWADVIISRSGAGSIAEILHFKKPSILIPLDSSSADHQRENAKFISNKWLAVYLDPSDLDEDWIIEILEDSSLINSLKNNLNKTEDTNAVWKILEIISSFLSP